MKLLKRFIKYYKPNIRLFSADLAAALAMAGCGLVYPVITRKMINEYIPQGKIKTVAILGAVLLGVYFIKMMLSYFMNYYGHIVGVRMQAAMRRDAFEHLEKLPFGYFDSHKTGTLMSKVINDLFDVSELAHHGPEDIFLSAVLLIGSFILMAGINIWLTLIMFAAIPLFIIILMKKRLKMRDAFTETRAETAEINSNLENSISGIRATKAFNNYKGEAEKFDAGNKKFIKARSKAYKVMSEFICGTQFIVDFLNVVLLVAGGLFIYKGKIDAGDFAAFIIFVSIFMDPIKRLVSFIEQYQDGMSGFRRFAEVMEAEPEKDSENAITISNVKGDIEFRDVTFSYNETKNILSDVSFKIPRGKTIALVGPSGGGKTTICHIIPRFYNISEGSVLLDGTDIKNITLGSLRDNVGIVAQDVFLFSGTVFENIAYGKPDATKEEVAEAAKKAGLYEFIMSLEKGFDTYVGEHGVMLSGGQRQRVSIARVFLKNPPVLILDEATSALDNITETMIQKSLEELSRGRTTLIVAHRLSTVRNADEIIVVTDDGIAESGTHKMLLEKNGIYAGLYNSQFVYN